MAADLSPADAANPETGNPVYAYKPSLLGAPSEFRLASDALVWRIGGRSGSTPYRDIRRLRLSFRPVTMQPYRFVAEIWPSSGPKLQIASASWRSMTELERRDDVYAVFLTELHRRLADAGSRATFETGSPALIYWPGVVVFVAVALALAALTVQALQAGVRAGALFVALFLAAFLWQGGTFLRRNRPGSYTPDAIPARALPWRR
jgi:hypothetical protein